MLGSLPRRRATAPQQCSQRLCMLRAHEMLERLAEHPDPGDVHAAWARLISDYDFIGLASSQPLVAERCSLLKKIPVTSNKLPPGFLRPEGLHRATHRGAARCVARCVVKVRPLGPHPGFPLESPGSVQAVDHTSFCVFALVPMGDTPFPTPNSLCGHPMTMGTHLWLSLGLLMRVSTHLVTPI